MTKKEYKKHVLSATKEQLFNRIIKYESYIEKLEKLVNKESSKNNKTYVF